MSHVRCLLPVCVADHAGSAWFLSAVNVRSSEAFAFELTIKSGLIAWGGLKCGHYLQLSEHFHAQIQFHLIRVLLYLSNLYLLKLERTFWGELLG